MHHLDHPSKRLWEERYNWFKALNDKISGEGSYLVSEQAIALMAEVQSVFCAGAWIAVLILAITVVDAHLREIEAPGFTGNTKRLIEVAEANPQLQQLRLRRNALIHLSEDNPAITVEQQWDSRAILEDEARQAVQLMLETVYMTPSI